MKTVRKAIYVDSRNPLTFLKVNEALRKAGVPVEFKTSKNQPCTHKSTWVYDLVVKEDK